MNNNSWLPKYFAIVLDDDIVKYLDHDMVGVSTLYGMWLEWLAKEVNKQIKTRYEKLLYKAKSDYYVYWITAPYHANFGNDNARRSRFNICLENVLKEYNSMRIVHLKEHWNQQDDSLVQNGGYTFARYDAFWRSFDSAMASNVTKREQFLAKEVVPQKRKWNQENMASHPKVDDMKNFFKRHKNDKFHWHKDASAEDSRHHKSSGNRFLLPRLKF